MISGNIFVHGQTYIYSGDGKGLLPRGQSHSKHNMFKKQYNACSLLSLIEQSTMQLVAFTLVKCHSLLGPKTSQHESRAVRLRL